MMKAPSGQWGETPLTGKVPCGDAFGGGTLFPKQSQEVPCGSLGDINPHSKHVHVQVFLFLAAARK